MASIYCIEIDGWGDVGPAIAVTEAQGFADGTFTLTTAGTPPPATEYGAMIWVQGVSAVVADGYYTLTARDSTTFTMQATASGVTVTTATGLTGVARIEDHYRISDGIPSWVTGSDAQDRWYRDLVNVSESAGQSFKPPGGIATIDGFEFTMARGRGLAAMKADTYRLSAVGPVILGAPIDGTEAEIVTLSAAPYAGESASSPTGPAQPSWVGTEAIDVRGAVPSPSIADGVSTYTATHNGTTVFVARGVLRTFARAHSQGVAIFGGLPTPIGQVGRAFVYPDGHDSHADRVATAKGTIDLINPSIANSTAQRLGLASPLFTSAGIVGDRAWIRYRPIGSPGDSPASAEQSDGSIWKFGSSHEYAAVDLTRVSFAATNIDASGLQTWEYTFSSRINTRTDFPMIRPAPDVATWEHLNLQRLYDHYFYGDPDMRPEDMPDARRRVIYVDSDGSIGFDATDIVSDDEGRGRLVGASMCHIFYPITWARTRNDLAASINTRRMVEVNPVDVVLEILTSTGYASNGAHDGAPSLFGLSIDRTTIDEASFTEVGNRFDATAITAGTVALVASEENDLSDRLSVLLKTYGLAIATTTTGSIKLIDLAHIDYDTSTTLDEGDLVAGVPSLHIDAGNAINGVSLEYKHPWRSPGEAGFEQTIIVQGSTGGLLDTLHRASGERVKIKPWFAASVGPTSRDALGIRWGRIIEQTNGVVGRIVANVDPGYSGQVGDTVSVTMPAFPNAQDSGAMSGSLCRIIDRIHVSRPVGDNPHDQITLLAYGVTAGDKPRQWAPSGVVSSVTTKKLFNLEPDTYHGADFASDAISFSDGSKIDIYTGNWSLRSTATPGTVSSTSGNTMTLSVAAASGGGDVTPNVGDKVTLSAESSQSASEAAKWGWLSSSTPGYLWR